MAKNTHKNGVGRRVYQLACCTKKFLEAKTK